MRRKLALLILTTAAAMAESFSVTVPGTSGFRWVNTGRYLAPNTSIQIQASGTVYYGPDVGSFGPSGTAAAVGASGFPAPDSRRYSLVSRLTASTANPQDELRDLDRDFASYPSFCARQGGNLWFTANDSSPSDNTGEYAVTVTLGACGADPTPGPVAATGDIQVTGMEVTQAIQVYPGNLVPFVGFKRTVVRVLVQSTGNVPWTDVTGRLTVRNVSGTYAGVSIRDRFLLPSTADSRSAITASNAGSDRTRLDNSLNFVLDLDQTAPGERELEVEITTISRRSETDLSNNRLRQRIRFGPPRNISVLGVTHGNTNTPERCRNVDPDDVVVPFANFEPHRRWTENAYPVSNLFIVPMLGTGEGPLFDNSNCDAFEQAHTYFARYLARLRPTGGATAFMLSPLPRFAYDGWCCTGDGGNQLARGSDQWFDPGSTMAHELAHSWGLAHTFEDPSFPYTDNSIGGNIGMRTNLGVFGSGLTPMPGRNGDGTPANFDFMSYSVPNWVAPYTYCGLMAAMSGGAETCGADARRGTMSAPEFSVFSSARTAEDTALRSGKGSGRAYLYVAGTIGAKTQSVELEPMEVLHAEADLAPQGKESGFAVTFRDKSGKRLASFPFDPPKQFYKAASLRFGVYVPYYPEAASITVDQHGITVATRSVSAAHPKVDFEGLRPKSLAGGVASGKHDISWKATDGDGDAVTCSIDYSGDAGFRWLPVALSATARKATVNFDNLPGGDQALLRVSCTDGVNTTVVEQTETFRVSRKAPVVRLSTDKQELTVAAGRTLPLDAIAFDLEDGALDHPLAYRWTLDYSEEIGTGQWINVSGLKPGKHTIGLIVRDSDGDLTKSEIAINVLPEGK